MPPRCVMNHTLNFKPILRPSTQPLMTLVSASDNFDEGTLFNQFSYSLLILSY